MEDYEILVVRFRSDEVRLSKARTCLVKLDWVHGAKGEFR